MSKKIKILDETEIKFKSYEQLSYKDIGEEDVEVFVGGESRGFAKVWLDSEMGNREYICINYEIIHLDTLKKIW